MIEIACVHLENKIILDPEHPFLLIEENADEFYRVVCEFYGQFLGKEGDYAFLKDSRQINPEDAGIMIRDCFGIDFTDRKSTAAVLKTAEKQYIHAELLPELNKLNAAIGEFVQHLTSDLPFAVEYNEVGISELLKTVGLRAAEHYDGFLEKLVCYVNFICGIRRVDFIVFVNLKSVLGDEKLRAFYKHCLNEKVPLLLVESGKIRPLLPEERAIIITDDLCEIVENYPVI